MTINDAAAWASGQLLAGCSGNTVTVWNALGEQAPGSLSHTITASSTLNSVQWTTSNKVLAAAGSEGIISLYNAGNYLGCLPNEENMATSRMAEITCARFSRDSKTVYAGSTDTTIYVWDLKSQALAHKFTEHKMPVTCLAVAPDDKYIASSAADGSLMMHTPGASKAFVTLAATAKAGERVNERRCLTFSPLEEGVLAAVGEDYTVTVWTTMGGKTTQISLPRKHTARVMGVALSPANPAYVFSCAMDGVVALWDKRSGDRSSVVGSQQLGAQLTSLALRDDGSYLAAGSKEGKVFVLDPRKLSPLAELKTADKQPISELHWQSAFRAKAKPSLSSATASMARAVGATTAQPTPMSSAYTAAATTKFDAGAAAGVAAAAAVSNPSNAQTQALRSSAGGSGASTLQGSLSNWLHTQTASMDVGNAGQSMGSVTVPPDLRQQVGINRALSETTNKPPGATPAAQEPGNGALERRPAALHNASSVLGPGGVEGVVPGDAGPAEVAPTGRAVVSPTSPSKGLSGSGRVLTGTLSGVVRGGLSEAVFKGMIEEVSASVRDDIRNLHIELLRQFHVQQMEMARIVQEVTKRQDVQAAEIHALRHTLELLMHKESLGSYL